MILVKEKRGSWRMVFACLLAAFLVLTGLRTVYAAGGLELVTAYPGMSVKPGDSLSISVDLENSSGSALNADVEIASLPDGWEGYLQGGSYQVNRVHVGTDGASITLHVTVPKECAEGTYQAVVKAAADTGAESTLPISFTISEEKAGAGSFTSEYPQQEGASGTDFSFSTTLINNGLTTKSYSLSSNAPAGWTLTFVPSGETTKIAGIDVESGESKGITVSVMPPEQIAAGEYDISCSAVSADETLSVDLKVVITGTYGLVLTTPDGRLSFDAQSGKSSDVTLNLENTGNVDLEQVSLNSTAPSGWTVTYEGLEDNSIDSIAAGTTKEVIAHVKPANDTITGDYVTSFTARTDETSSSVDFRVSVKTSTLWGIAAVAIIVIVIGGLGYVFRKYGRR
ncbi:MAG: NEW3 domain-containing protein [Clostridiales bacterium]|nr:NEW3 domain-containing protein [Clostridiales bacterium]